MMNAPTAYQVFVCHTEAKTDSQEYGALWREVAPDVNYMVMSFVLKWLEQGAPRSAVEQRCVRIWLGSAEYIIDLGALIQKRMDLTQGATRRLKIVMPVTEDTIPVGHDLQFSIMHKEANTYIQDCGALWRPYTPEVNSKVADDYVKWKRRGSHSDDPGKSVDFFVGEAKYIVDFAAMTQTRIINDWKVGATRKLRVDTCCVEG